MKKTLLMLMLLVSLILVKDIHADAKECSNKKMIVSCKYKLSSGAEFRADVVKNGNGDKIETDDNSIGSFLTPANQIHNELYLNHFLDKNNNYVCPNQIYWLYNASRVDNPSYVSVVKKNNSTVKGIFKLQKNQSCSNVKKIKNNSKKTQNKKKEKEEFTCYYGPTTVILNTSKKTIKLIGSNVDTSNIQYPARGACPNYLCLYPVGSKIQPQFCDVLSSKMYAHYCYKGTEINSDYKCLFISNYMKKIEKEKTYSNKYNESKSQLKSFCNLMLQTGSYNEKDDEGELLAESICLQECIKINEVLAERESQQSQGRNSCNLSGKILSFIHNILKWMKYIAPVLVIILGILDFIKALASSDDDAMKKAQKRFITRLIAAALLFLLPLIVDYILRIFNLYDKNCDITELFK